MEHTTQFALVGPGRAGTAMTEALTRAGWHLRQVAGREPSAPSVVRAAARWDADAVDVSAAGHGASVVILAVPDAAVADVAGAVAPSAEPGALVVHLSGALGLEAFHGLEQATRDVLTAAAHPLQTFPGLPGDADRVAGTWFAVDGDPKVGLMVEVVAGRSFRVRDRTAYHAAACVASNHLVALLGQVERLAAAAGVAAEAFQPLVEATVANVAARGAPPSLSGPIARGDAGTVAAHLDALPADERPAYRALAREALRLTGRHDPALQAILDEPAPEVVS